MKETVSLNLADARDSVVSWDGDNDTLNPKNWAKKRKWMITLIVSCFNFISPVSSSMISPALPAIGHDLHIDSSSELAMTLSIFVLAYAVGPLFLAPLSEMYGRVIILQVANIFYLIFNTCCGFAQSEAQLVIFRILAGLGGSAPLSLGGGILSDCWKPEERGKAWSIYSLAPMLGPAVGPIIGGFITDNASWRWVFWTLSFLDIIAQLFAFFFLSETYAPRILYLKAEKLRKHTNNMSLRTEFEKPSRDLATHLKTNMTRPFKLLGTQVIIQILSLYMALLYGLVYLMISTFPILWTNVYHESTSIGSLNNLSLALGCYIGSQIAAQSNDRLYIRLKHRLEDPGRPEFRVPLMIIGSFLVPSGLFIYGWTANAPTHWIYPNIGAVVFSAGVMMNFQCIQVYVVDAYEIYAASALAAIAVLRSIAGFGFPLFAPALFNRLGYGWGSSVLSLAAILIGVPSPFLLWIYGQRLRARGPLAAV